jgi:hypothetical protein
VGKKARVGKKGKGAAAREESDIEEDEYSENGVLSQLNSQTQSSRGRALKKSKKMSN